MGRLSTTECTYLPTYLCGVTGGKGFAHVPMVSCIALD